MLLTQWFVTTATSSWCRLVDSHLYNVY